MKKTLEIRVADISDAPALREIYAPYVENTTITFEYIVPPVAEFEARIDSTLERYPYLVALLDGVPVGYAYASRFKARAAYDYAVETSVYVKEGEHGKGIGSALYDSLEAILAEQHITNLNACITYPGTGSIEFHITRGYATVAHFHKCGYKFGKWLDMVWMEKFIAPHDDTPQPFIHFSDLPTREAEKKKL